MCSRPEISPRQGGKHRHSDKTFAAKLGYGFFTHNTLKSPGQCLDCETYCLVFRLSNILLILREMQVLVHNSGNPPPTRKVKSETSPCTQKVRERWKKEANHSRLTGGSFDEQGNLHRRLVFHVCTAGRSPHPSARNLTVYTEALTGFNHGFSPHGLNTTLLSQSRLLETIFSCGNDV